MWFPPLQDPGGQPFSGPRRLRVTGILAPSAPVLFFSVFLRFRFRAVFLRVGQESAAVLSKPLFPLVPAGL